VALPLQISAGMGYRSAQEFVIGRSSCAHQFNNSNQTHTIFNNHDNSVENLLTVSTDNPVMMLIFIIYSLVLCWGNVSNSKVT